MGKMKSRKGSGAAQRLNPVGLPSVQTLERLEEDGLLSDDDDVTGCAFVSRILEQLHSHVAEERDSGLNSLSVACQRTSYLEEIGKSDIIKTVAPLLLDPSPSVRHSAAGALRNLSCASPEFSDFMVKQDVMTPLIALFKTKYGNWIPPTIQAEKVEKNATKIDTASETLVEAVTLLWNLCENSSVAVKIFNREQLGDTLSKYLNTIVFGTKVAISVAQCLYTSSEDNVEAISSVSDIKTLLNQILMTTQETEEIPDLMYLKTLAIGILLNLFEGEVSKVPSANIRLITEVLSSALAMDHISAVNKFSSDVPIQSNGSSEKEVIHSQRDGEDVEFKKVFYLEEQLSKLLNLLSCQTLALEILSNIMFTEDLSIDEDDSGEDMEEDMTNSVDVEMGEFNPGVPLEVYEGIVKHDVLSKVLNKVKAIPANVFQILKENKEYGNKVITQLTRERCTALLCLQNLIEGLEFSDVEKSTKVTDVWTGLGSMLLESDPSASDVVEAVTSAMRAIIQAWTSQSKLELCCDIFVPAFPVFYDAYAKVTIPKVRVNIVKIVGGMGLLTVKLVNNPVDVSALLSHVGMFLVSCFPAKIDKESLWIVAEVLDTIYDVFGEDDYNPILTEIGLIAKLNILQPQFKKQVRNERRSLGEYKAVIQTANSNLSRFIKYKIEHGVS